MKTKKLNFFNVAIMYVGTIMGAGFASGREGWQFFGVFGDWAFVGIIVAGLLFMALGVMVSYIARSLQTDDMGKIIVCTDNPKIANFVGYFMAAILYTIITSMSAAGGSFLSQQFGIHKAFGGALIVILVILTVLGNFERISRVFRMIIPVLFAIDIVCCILIITSDIEQSGMTSGFQPSSMAPTWIIAAFLFISYNMMGMIPIVAAASVNAKSRAQGILGAGLGGLLLAGLTAVLVLALQKDMAYTQSMDLPMLAFTARISKVANLFFGIVLFFAIYSAATSTYYGFSTKLKETPKKKYIIIVGAWIGFICGLTGFRTIVAYLYPIEGYIGFVVILSITLNFIRVYRLNKLNNRKEPFAYPNYITRVTAGHGGESLLIFGSEKTALYDCGMAYCHHSVVKNIKYALESKGRKSLDYILISHTHYDHIGALPYILQEWPEAIVCGAKKAETVFASKGALITMKRLGEAARDSYSDSKEPIIVEGMRIDQTVKSGDEISLGNEYFSVIETPGHTSCSVTYVLEPAKLMLLSESTGILRNWGQMHTAILKSYQDTMDSAMKCKHYGAEQLISPHYGMVAKSEVKGYFDLYVKAAQMEKEFILSIAHQGMNEEQIMEKFEEKFWSVERGKGQPKEAFYENAQYTIKHILEEFNQD